MAAPSSLNPAAASSFKAFTPAPHTSLTSSIDVLFGLTVACFAAGTAYCASKLYNAYQCYQHTSFGLPDELKLVKCRTLLLAADEKKAAGENVELLLQECESLFNSISNGFRSNDKEKFLVKLAQHYVEKDPEHACLIAMRLTSSTQLFKAAQNLQQRVRNAGFNRGQVNPFYQRAKAARQLEKPKENSFEDVEWSLKLAQGFHFAGNTEGTGTCLTKACNITETFTDSLTKIEALCGIAKCSHKIGNPTSKQTSVVQAERLLSNLREEHLIQARLYLAHTYLALGETGKMEQELREMLAFFYAHPTEIHKDLYLFAEFISKISKNPTYGSQFCDMQPLFVEVLRVLEKPKLPPKDEANAYLNIARIFQENLVEDTVSEATIKLIAYEIIIKLPIDSAEDRNSKIELLVRLGSYSKQQPKEARIVVLEHLEQLYGSCPFESADNGIWNKMELGETIVKFYNKMKMEAESKAFFQKWTSDLISREDQTASSKINILASTVKRSRSDFSPEQRDSLVQEVQKLFPQLSLDERKTCKVKLANDYLDVDIDISPTFLREWESDQAKASAIRAAITAVAMGAIYFYPGANPLLLVGVTVLRMF